jgi:hypothetical protein
MKSLYYIQQKKDLQVQMVFGKDYCYFSPLPPQKSIQSFKWLKGQGNFTNQQSL